MVDNKDKVLTSLLEQIAFWIKMFARNEIPALLW